MNNMTDHLKTAQELMHKWCSPGGPHVDEFTDMIALALSQAHAQGRDEGIEESAKVADKYDKKYSFVIGHGQSIALAIRSLRKDG